MLRETIKKELSNHGEFLHENGDVNLYALEKATIMQKTQIKNFLSGEQGTNSKNIDSILDALDVIDIIFVTRSDL